MKAISFLILLSLSWTSFAQEMDEELPEIEASVDAQYADTRVPLETQTEAKAEVKAESKVINPTTAVATTAVADSAPEVAVGEPQAVNSAPINVDGYLTGPQKVQDPELLQIHGEIQRQKKEVVLNKKKAKTYNELSRSVEALSETTEEMLEEKRAAKEQIAEYNAKVKCLQADAPGPECDKYVKRRR
jgi:hypothetical protein